MDVVLKSEYRKQLSVWIIGICILVASMVVVGGVTRLTNSGLSITEWKPLIGALPPMNQEDWTVLFEKYKQIPEYSIEHPNMDIEGFKFIFYWEWGHRNLGRFMGLFFFIPYLIFFFQKKLTPQINRRLLIGFGLGGLQGLMGWLMVKSGLVDRVDVSHFRLAAHLILAFVIFSYFLRILLDLNVPKSELIGGAKFKKFRFGIVILHSILGIQIIYGAFVAGLRAGYMFNTYPKMGDVWVPLESFAYTPSWLSVFENPVTVQFVHRWLGAFIVFSSLYLVFAILKGPLPRFQRMAGILFSVMVLVQFLLGVFTLVYKMPLSLASLHQLGGLALYGSLSVLLYSIRKEEVIS